MLNDNCRHGMFRQLRCAGSEESVPEDQGAAGPTAALLMSGIGCKLNYHRAIKRLPASLRVVKLKHW